MKITEQEFWEFIGKLSVAFLIAAIFGFICYEDNFRVLELKIKTLEKDNISLETDLNTATNEIYDLNLELAKTEKILAETAQNLQELQDTQQGQEQITLTYVGEYTCTAYCTETYSHICGGGGNTASGLPVIADVSVATTDFGTFSYGDIIYIEDVGIRIIQDTGGFSKNKLDVAVKTHKEATNWKGQGKHRVYLLEVTENGEE